MEVQKFDMHLNRPIYLVKDGFNYQLEGGHRARLV